SPATGVRSVSESAVIILVADGIRPDTLSGALQRGEVPALAALAAESGGHTIVTSFPSVSIVGYVPILAGRHPAAAGIPGLRWYDRARSLPAALGHARSYVGLQLRRIDRDLDPAAPTAFELAPGTSLGMMSGVARGLAPAQRLDTGWRFGIRASWLHARGDVAGWLALDRELGERLVHRVGRERPRFVFAAFAASDKAAHAHGHDSAAVLDGLRTVDHVVAMLRHQAERDGRWRDLHLWVVSDHGHAPIAAHEDLERFVRRLGFRVRAHPWTTPLPADVAVMVSGNAMAHLYLGLVERERRFWPTLAARWQGLADALVERPAVDLLLIPHSPTRVAVRSRTAGTAVIEFRDGRYSYRCLTGDPLALGELDSVSADEALERSASGPYPDSLVQVAALAASARCGDLVVSASPGWDLRARYEPVNHVSTHGALHRDQMRVPLLLNRPAKERPLRTVDLFRSALRVLGVAAPPAAEGRAFV
ncbi:MAG TPA: alkaline phosphatase family protein, partial [Gemmatimonadaceae bacterium]